MIIKLGVFFLGLEWALSEISKHSELVQAYFCDLWFSCEKQWLGSKAFYVHLLILAHSQFKTESILDTLTCFMGTQPPKKATHFIVLSLTKVLKIFFHLFFPAKKY